MTDDRSTIGASHAAAIVGVSPYSNPFVEWLYYTGQADGKDATEEMLIGTELENGIRLIAERHFNQPIPKPHGRVHPSLAFVAASPDGLLDQRTGLELKNVGPYSRWDWGPTMTDDVPDHVRVQCYHQCAVFGLDVVMVGALVCGNEFRQYRVERNDASIQALMETLCDFWKLVLERREPDPDWTSKHTQQAIGKLYGIRRGLRVELSEGDQLLVYDRRQHLQTAKDHTRAADALKAQLLHHMGDAEIGLLPDGSAVTRKEVHRAAYQVRATSYKTFNVKYAREGLDDESA